ncbi:MAG: calcium-binding protein, partial [Rhodobacteraceae bacterium]|nr:calcium-binding protein [Paracoccaceae bacterium]
GNSVANELKGAKGSDQIAGKKGDDRLLGGSGKDELIGGDGDDYLHGGKANDFLKGGRGLDILVGGSGKDTFHFSRGDGLDTIRDFDAGVDQIKIGDGATRMKDLTFARSGGDVTVTFANVEITVQDITKAELNDSDNFIF